MQVQRVLNIIQKLSLGPETVSSLHQKLTEEGVSVSQRTVYRDLLMMEDAFRLGNIRLVRYEGEFNKATWIITTTDERTAPRSDLYLKTFLTENLKPEWEKYFTGNTIEDVFQAISVSEAAVIQNSISQFSVEHSNWGEFVYHHEHYNRLKDIIWAISNQRIIHIAYYDHTVEVEYRFRPLKVIYHRGALNILGWRLHDGRAEMHFQELDCIRTTSITNERFHQVNEEAAVRQTLKERFGIHDSTEQEAHRIVLEMEEGPAIFLKNRNWHPTQSFRKENGRWLMEFTCIVNIELLGWIFSWLEHVKVVEPPFLRDIIEARAAYIYKMYRDDLPAIEPMNTDDPLLIGR